MGSSDLILVRRKGEVRALMVIAAVVGLVIFGVEPVLGVLLWFAAGWPMAAYWVSLDAARRNVRRRLWVTFTVFAGPVALVLYCLSRPPAPVICEYCGTTLTDAREICPSCGRQAFFSRAAAAGERVCSSLMDALARGPVDRARDTAKHMAIALAVMSVFVILLLNTLFPPYHETLITVFLRFLWGISAAGYWVLTAWWVYLDARWRRMEAVPWATLTLVTNLFGLVTYLVIRYPDPRVCPQCGAHLTVGLKLCPYCGAEAEPTCPKCQASVRPDWVYCPVCASKLPSAPSPSEPAETAVRTLVSIRGTVTDAVTSSPIASADVKIDSKTDARITFTDALGRYLLADLEPRSYVLIASADGYSWEAKAYTPSPGREAPVDFVLYPIPQS